MKPFFFFSLSYTGKISSVIVIDSNLVRRKIPLISY